MRHIMASTCPRSGGLAVLVAAGAIGLAACTSGSGPPQVASLGTSSGSDGGTAAGSAPAASPAGNPTQLLDEWAACMRSHGDPSQVDPTIDADKEITRANGVPKFPDPNPADPGETNVNGTGIDPSSPFFQNADKLCDERVGIPYVGPSTPDPGNVMVRSFNGPGGQAPSGPPPSGAQVVPGG
jgi:hypothetical protein